MDKELKTIITEDELKLKFTGILMHYVSEINVTSYIIIGTLDEYEHFIRSNNIQQLFYKYAYYDTDEYFISSEQISEYAINSKEKLILNKFAQKRNAQISTIDFTKPYRLSLICIDNQLPVCFELENKWLDISTSEEALVSYLEEHEEELIECIEDDGFSLYDELKAKLFADLNFRLAKNKDLRRSYARNFMSKTENNKYYALVRPKKASPYVYNRLYEFTLLIDKCYEEYKIACRIAKVKIGEEIPKTQKK